VFESQIVSLNIFRLFRRWTTNLVALVVLFMVVPQSWAGTPSYIGPWTYSSASYASGPWLASLDAAWSRQLAKLSSLYCGGAEMRWSSGYDWTWSGSLIEGVSYNEGRYVDYRGTEWNGLYTACNSVSPWYAHSLQMYRQRVVCTSTQRFLDSKCVDIVLFDLPGRRGSNLGHNCTACGEPISISTGNMWHDEVDFQDGPEGNLSFSRTYNSIFWNAVQGHLLGTRWTTEYDARLRPVSPSTKFSDQRCYKRTDNNKIFCEFAGDLNATLLSASAIQVTRSDGKTQVFNVNSGAYVSAADTVDRLSATTAPDNSITGFQYEDGKTGAIETYDTTGLLLTITSAKGSTRRLTYSNGTSNDTSLGRYPASAPVCTGPADPGAVLPSGYLLCVTDDWGRQLNFAYDSNGRVKAMTDPSGNTSLYEYDGATGGCSASAPNNPACKANNLTKLTHPDGTARKYVYNESANINGGAVCSNVVSVGNGFGHLLYSMTGLIDEKGVRYITWGYNCAGYATSSQLAGGVEKVSIVNSFSTSTAELITSNQVTTYLGNPASPQTASSTFTPTLVLDDYKNTAVSALCSVCGTTKARTFDANGNPSTLTDFLGNVTKFTYDLSRNLETSRIEGYGSTAARTITTSWHSTLRVRTGVAEPKRITTYTYDAHGSVLTRTVQATSDTTGAAGFGATPVGTARVWRYEYNPYGQLTKETGPRTDIADVTTYAYDVKGNLNTVTNALGHVTTLSAYDDSGRVGSILAPNGTLTQLTYTTRGKLASRTVSHGDAQQTTSYEYDPVGQLTKVTNPDGSWFAYGYDDAHRLTSISDSLGNSVVYTLDLTGNRLSEQVKDPNGVLTRQISRVYNTLNQLMSVTGAEQ